jgi:hypothetical protein
MTLYASSIPFSNGNIIEKPQHAIKQKFRFNKMLFYIKMGLQTLFNAESIQMHQMGAARAGPIPFELKDGLKRLEQKGLITIYNEWNGKKINKGDSNWEELNRTRAGACVAVLTDSGVQIAESIWNDMNEIYGAELTELISSVKQKLFKLNTDQLKTKVHTEYPEYQHKYTDDDQEDFCD